MLKIPRHYNRIAPFSRTTILALGFTIILLPLLGGANRCGSPQPEVTWTAGDLSSLPANAELEPLPGGGNGTPVFTSNNPEKFTSAGFLYQIARPDPARGGASYPLTGTFGVYLHHLNASGQTMYLHILITNPNNDPLTVSGFGSGYNQTDTGGIGQGHGPDYQVAEDWLSGQYSDQLRLSSIGSFKALDGWVKKIPNGQEVDGRFEFTTSDPAYVYLIAATSADVSAAVNLTQTAAAGDIRAPGNPPPPYGREAGVYAHDTWQGDWSLTIPGPGYRLGYVINTATGTGYEQIQAFPALSHFDDSSKESVGMYGNQYRLNINLRHGGATKEAQRVDIYFAAYAGGSPNFFFNGPLQWQDAIIPVYLTPNSRAQKIGEVSVPVNGEATASVRIPIPGLSSIPQAIFFVTR